MVLTSSCKVAKLCPQAHTQLHCVVQFLGDRRPSEAIVSGVLVLVAAAGCLPLVLRYYDHAPGVKRTLVLAASAGMLLILLRPPLPMKVGMRCAHSHVHGGLCPGSRVQWLQPNF